MFRVGIQYFLMLVLFVSSSTFSKAFAAGLSCRNIFQKTSASDLITHDSLEVFRQQEIQSLSREQILEKNRETLERVESFVPEREGKRAQSISLTDVNSLIPYVYNHEVSGNRAHERYSRENVEIGYCFGRATFVHLLLLKMGLQKQSIMKVWAVGHMNAGNVEWGFHVATVAYVTGKGWMAIDTNGSAPVTLREWFKKHQAFNTDGQLRFYMTEPSRFTVDVKKYDPTQLGLNLGRDDDWYKHYFKDLMTSIAGKNAEQLGVKSIVSEPVANESNFWSDFFGGLRF